MLLFNSSRLLSVVLWACVEVCCVVDVDFYANETKVLTGTRRVKALEIHIFNCQICILPLMLLPFLQKISPCNYVDIFLFKNDLDNFIKAIFTPSEI